LKAVHRPLSGFAMLALVGDFGKPLTGLAIHVVKVCELAQRPEILAHVSDAAAFHFPFFPAAGQIAGSRDEVVFAGEAQETRVETHQAAIMFRHGRGQVVIVDFPAHTVECRKCMNVASYESLETLAVGEL